MRLPTGGLIDRARPLTLRFDGRPVPAYEGDTLASALIANDIALVARSFKYHRPRGILTAGAEEPNALVSIAREGDADPNARATTAEAYHGLTARSQNRWPSLAFDMGAVNGLLSPLFVAGFYYKTFMWPAALWEKLYEPLIRRAAGIGRLSGLPDPSRYDRAHAFADLLVIGSGPSGLMAAITAGRAGARVWLVEDDFRFGGRLLAETHEIDGLPGRDWARAAHAELAALPNVTLKPRTLAFGLYDGGTWGLLERLTDHLAAPTGPRQRYWKLVAGRTILATGATERPLVFGGNDRPGVMMASAARAYANRWAAAPGGRVALFTCGDDAWRTVRDLAAAGVEIAAVIDSRAEIAPAHQALASQTGARVFGGGAVTSTHGRSRLRALDIRDGNGRTHRLAADTLLMAGGWNPAMGLGCNLGGRPKWSEAVHSFVLDQPPRGLVSIGAAAGRFSLAQALADGARAGAEAATALGLIPHQAPSPHAEDEPTALTPLWRVADSHGKAFVDFQHDVTDADVALSAREGFRSVEHLKRYTTLGMATDQGKLSNVSGHALLAAATGKRIAEAGTILSRPPYLPVAIAAFAGDHRGEQFRPVRHTPSHAWAEEHGAVFTDSGQWKRAEYYPRPGETHWRQTVDREVTATRTGVGVCDVSTLGKIDVHGPDAGAFLDRLYVNAFSTLAVGKARYGVMLREDGLVLDDGTATRLAPDHYFVTTTTANAARVMQHMEYARQVIWPDLDVGLASVTEQWAQFAIAGPKSRDLLERLFAPAPPPPFGHLPRSAGEENSASPLPRSGGGGGEADGGGLGPSAMPNISDAALPYMAARELTWRGVPARLFRLSFSGERAYELAVPAAYGDSTIRAIMAAGEPLGITPYGVEALGVMRIEKGHAAGGELNGTVTAADLGLGRMMSAKKDFIGRALAGREALVAPDRWRLVGLKPVDPTQPISGGAHLLPVGAPAQVANDQGYVTSAAHSPTLGHTVALALVKCGHERHGERLRAWDGVRDRDTLVELCPPVFVDPEGTRLRG